METAHIEIRKIPYIVNTPEGDNFAFLNELVEVAIGVNEVEFRKNMHQAISNIRKKYGLPTIFEHEVEHPDLPKSHWVVHRRLGNVKMGYWKWVYRVLTEKD